MWCLKFVKENFNFILCPASPDIRQNQYRYRYLVSTGTGFKQTVGHKVLSSTGNGITYFNVPMFKSYYYCNYITH
jgi:hypothetical protein